MKPCLRKTDVKGFEEGIKGEVLALDIVRYLHGWLSFDIVIVFNPFNYF